MTTYTFSGLKLPTRYRMRMKTNTTAKRSPLTGAVQTITRPGSHWQIEAEWINLWDSDRAELIAFFARLNGREHRVKLPVFNHAQRGPLNGTPVVDGGSQTGNTLNIRGATASQSPWARAFDYVMVAPQLFMVAADVSSDGSGDVALKIIPSIRDSFIDGLAVETDLSNIYVTCIMVSDVEDVITGSAGAGNNFSDLSLSFVEDITA